MDELENSLNKADLLQLVAMLADLQRAFASLQMQSDEDKRKAVMAGLECVIAGMRAMELAKHLHDGKQFYDALRATVRGDLKIEPDVAIEWQAHLDRLRDPTRHD
jgi:hypothetical protein